MQNRQFKIYSLITLCFVAVVSFLAACKKDDMTGQVRLFRPVLKDELVSGGNWIDATWQSVKGAVGYTVQISRDTFKTIDQTVTLDTNTVSFEDLEWNKLYQVQVKALAQDTSLNSRFSNLGAVKTPKFPTILISPAISDLTDEAARVRWTNSGDAVTSIKVYLLSDSSFVKEVILTGTDIANQYKIVNGLGSNTTYIIYLYSGATIRGWDNYTTKAPLTGDIVDLRTIEGRTAVLQDTLPLINSGSIVLLKRGFTYTISAALSLSKSVTIMSGDDLSSTERATIFLSSNFNIAAGSVIDQLVFKDVSLYSDSYSGKYVFNINAACTIGKIEFQSCRSRIYRGMVRLQTAVINIDNFIINDCIIDSVSNYGVVNADNINCKINNISITNSTFYKVEKFITSKQNSLSVTIDNCTINEAPFGGNYLIDYSTSGTNNVTNGIKISNTIMGIGYNNAGVTAVRGIRVGTASIDVSNTYNTSDYTVTSNAIPNITAYTKPSTDLWTDPTKGVFTIRESSFPGKNTAGDPRWRP